MSAVIDTIVAAGLVAMAWAGAYSARPDASPVQHDASYPWEEPGAGNPHARIREGESRMAELLDQPLSPPRVFH
jgi:hypothetical protein